MLLYINAMEDVYIPIELKRIEARNRQEARAQKRNAKKAKRNA